MGRIFPKSQRLNRYYAAQIGEYETAEVEVLSGSCMLLKRDAMVDAGGGFDEAYFMYCEDLDLCYRLTQRGYQNYYFPETTIVHFKGESTRKLTYTYLDIFYKAMAVFVRKYYPRRLGAIYMLSIRFILLLRNIVSFFRHIFSYLKLFILDAILITFISILIKNFWFEKIALAVEDSPAFAKTIPFFTVIWLLSLFLSGAYDKPISLFRTGRGMIIGTVLVLAWYSMFPIGYRYSRGVVLFTGMTSTVALLFVRILLSQLSLIRLVPTGRREVKSVVVGSRGDFEDNLSDIKKYTVMNTVYGRVASEDNSKEEGTLGRKENLAQIQRFFEIEEFVFLVSSLSFEDILCMMEQCRGRSYYKFKINQVAHLVGDHYGKSELESFRSFQNYALLKPSGRRNKRLFDVLASCSLLIAYPFLRLFTAVDDWDGFRRNLADVVTGRKTWVGYEPFHGALPEWKPAVVPPYLVQKNFAPSLANRLKVAQAYAFHYSVLEDLKFLLLNFRYLGSRSS